MLKKPFTGLRTDLIGIPEYRASAPTISDNCVSKLLVRIAVANWCEKGANEANDPEDNRADYWIPVPVIAQGSAGAPGSGSSKFTDPGVVQATFWTTMTVKNANAFTLAADIASCTGAALHEVAVQPAGPEIDTYLADPPFTKDPAPY